MVHLLNLRIDLKISANGLGICHCFDDGPQSDGPMLQYTPLPKGQQGLLTQACKTANCFASQVL